MNKTMVAVLLAMVLASPASAEVHPGPTENAKPDMADGAPVPTASSSDGQQEASDPPAARNSDNIRDLVTAVAEEHGVPPAMAHAIVQVESRYDCAAKNPRSSATGLMQTLRGTARSVGVTGDLQDCRNGLEAGMRYLKRAVEVHGLGCAAASAYNTGISSRGRCTPYGRKVLTLMDRAGEKAQQAKL
jgi:soluble lytic murein transglycosylase-like protein